MNPFPPLPAWESAHPFIVHFPIALLFVAFIPMVIGLVDWKRRWVWQVAGLLLLLLGTAGAFVAVMSGEATEHKLVVTSEVIEEAIEHHEHAGEFARTLAVAATALFVVVLGLGAGLKKGKGRRIAVAIGALAFAGVYGFALSRLAWAGHRGGELVHAYGVRAPMAPSEAMISPATADDDEEAGEGVDD